MFKFHAADSELCNIGADRSILSGVETVDLNGICGVDLRVLSERKLLV